MEVAFTERELDVMGVLWDRGPSTVAEVQAALSDELAYTTVLTMLRTLEEKGHIAHDEEGRAYRYYPLVERSAAGASAVGRLLRKLFRGSPELLLTHLVAERGLTREQLASIRALLDDHIGDDPIGDQRSIDERTSDDPMGDVPPRDNPHDARPDDEEAQ
jgi:BlaI family transcriptional regulator, penicillinase repressor